MQIIVQIIALICYEVYHRNETSSLKVITPELPTYPWVYTIHKAMKMIPAKLTTPLGIYYPKADEDYIKTELIKETNKLTMYINPG